MNESIVFLPPPSVVLLMFCLLVLSSSFSILLSLNIIHLCVLFNIEIKMKFSVYSLEFTSTYLTYLNYFTSLLDYF